MEWWTWKTSLSFITRRKRYVTIGDQKIEVKPLTLENSLKLFLLIGPYLAHLEDKWPLIAQALATTNGTRPKLLETLFTQLRNDLAFAPGAIVQAFALLIDRDIGWIAERATARDLLEAWPTLDRVNDFAGLFAAVKALGVVVKYGQ